MMVPWHRSKPSFEREKAAIQVLSQLCIACLHFCEKYFGDTNKAVTSFILKIVLGAADLLQYQDESNPPSVPVR